MGTQLLFKWENTLLINTMLRLTTRKHIPGKHMPRMAMLRSIHALLMALITVPLMENTENRKKGMIPHR